MARRHRDLTTSAFHHVVNRGVDRQDVFDTPEDRMLFEHFVERATERSEVEFHSYAWMSNHFHALVHDPTGRLHEAMRELQGRYAQAFNQRVDRTGPLWEPRFWSTPIRDEGQLLQTIRYIHRNPLDIAGTDGLIDYPYSSLAVYCGARAKPRWLTTDRFAPMLDPERHLEAVLTPQRTDRIPVAFLPALVPTSCAEIDDAVDALAVDDESAGLETLLRITMAVELRAASSDHLSVHFGLPVDILRSIAASGRRLAHHSPRFAEWQHRCFLALPHPRTLDLTSRPT